MGAPLACTADIDSRDGSGSDDRQLPVCNERYQAEGDNANGPDVDFDDWSVRKDHEGYEGDSYMDAGGLDAWLRWDYMNFAPGKYTLSIRYANGSGNTRPTMIRLNDDDETEFEMSFPPTGRWTHWQTVTKEIDARYGIRNLNIEVVTGRGGPNIDAIEVNAVEVNGC
ncbi:MAG: carbohydrate-binding protein [Myxococcota bacterium]